MSNLSALAELQRSLDSIFGRRPQRIVHVVEERRANKSAMAKARRLATRHGIEIERDNDGHWVTHPRFTDGDDDPCSGSHFCVGGREVLEAVEAYVQALSKE